MIIAAIDTETTNTDGKLHSAILTSYKEINTTKPLSYDEYVNAVCGEKHNCFTCPSSSNCMVDAFYDEYRIAEDLAKAEKEIEQDARQNMPCDTYGMAACTDSCPRYAKCNNWI